MSFAKAQDLIRLAKLAATRRLGVSLEDICQEFGVAHRTAQRMTEALEISFSNVTAEDGPDRRRRWRVTDPLAARLLPRQETAVEALEIAVRAARDEGRLKHAKALSDMGSDLLSRLQVRDAARTEADAEAVLSAMGSVTRPGPRGNLDPSTLDAIVEALRGPFTLQFRYGDHAAPQRVVEPYGVLLGHRSYLVARQPSRGASLLNFRIDRIMEAQVQNDSFVVPVDFTIDLYAARAFGAYQDESEFAEVVWRFTPKAADRASGYKFHPTQIMETETDGSLIVRFHAAGWLEMAWHLYQWGDQVEVLAPKGLKDLVEPYRRSDFAALP